MHSWSALVFVAVAVVNSVGVVVAGVVGVVLVLVVVLVVLVAVRVPLCMFATMRELFAWGMRCSMMPNVVMFLAAAAALHVGLAHNSSRSPWTCLASATNVPFSDLMTHCMSGLGRTSQ